jgi:hypothetical protein
MSAAPGAPKKPLTPYFQYLKEKRPQYKAEHPDAGPTDAAKALGAEWRALSDQDKAPYVKMTEADKARYEEAMKSYVPPIDPPASTKRKKAKKDPDAPKGPKSAYILFSADRRKEFKERTGESPSFAELGKMWREADPLTKTKYEKMAEDDKLRFKTETAKYDAERH